MSVNEFNVLQAERDNEFVKFRDSLMSQINEFEKKWNCKVINRSLTGHEYMMLIHVSPNESKVLPVPVA